MHIAVAGNIGAGKTTLTKLLAKHFKWEPHFEDVVDNPYLDDFYHQMERWSFNLQIYFLNSRFRQVLQIRESGKKIIQRQMMHRDHARKGNDRLPAAKQCTNGKTRKQIHMNIGLPFMPHHHIDQHTNRQRQ